MWNVLRKLALEYVKRVDPGKGVSLRSRRWLASLDYDYLLQVLLSQSQK
jgi:hypothetical protein